MTSAILFFFRTVWVFSSQADLCVVWRPQERPQPIDPIGPRNVLGPSTRWFVVAVPAPFSDVPCPLKSCGQGPEEEWKGLDFADADPRLLEALRDQLLQGAGAFRPDIPGLSKTARLIQL